jgi:TonB family protein
MRRCFIFQLMAGAAFLTLGQHGVFAQETPPCQGAPHSTHPFPPYPAAAAQNYEEGTVLVLVFLRPSGVPARVDLLKSSGFTDLDDAAISWIKDHWVWLPLQNGCPPEMKVAFNWSLGLLSRTNTKKYDPDAATKALMGFGAPQP